MFGWFPVLPILWKAGNYICLTLLDGFYYVHFGLYVESRSEVEAFYYFGRFSAGEQDLVVVVVGAVSEVVLVPSH